MLHTIELYFLLFITYSVLGWIMEVVGKLIELKKFVNRGFLVGPCCAIYGCGAIFITLLLNSFTYNPLILFLMSIVVCGTLEYATSYIMEKLFKARWWDYSKRKFNINGRVCLNTIIPFGILGCFILYVSNPYFIDLYNKLPELAMNIISGILLLIFIVDYLVSFGVVVKLRETTSAVNKENTEDNTEEITKKVKEILFSKSALNRRLFNAYPRLIAMKDKIKEQTERIQKSVNNATEEIKESIIETKDSIKENIEETKGNIKESIENTKGNIKNSIERYKNNKL